MIGLTPYARRECRLIVAIGVVLAAALGWWAGWWGLVPLGLMLAVLSFYRDPPRRVPTGDNLILAPADGRIVEIARDVDDGAGGRVLRIMIFLSVFNVHVNRAPCAGRVRDVAYRPGKFLNALNPAADRENEANTIVLAPAGPLPGPVRVRQIAGVLARRIVCACRVGDEMAAGQRYGMIKLGSRTEVVLPEDPRWRVLVSVGHAARGGWTALARLEPDAAG